MSEAIPEPDTAAGSVGPLAGAPEGVQEAWAEYKSNGSSRARDSLILHYSPLVKYVAGRVAVGLPANIEQAVRTGGFIGSAGDGLGRRCFRGPAELAP